MKTSVTPESAALSERACIAKRINKLTLNKIAEEAGIGYLSVQRQLAGKYNLDVRALLAIIRLSPNISTEWLMRGVGDILIGGNKGKTK